MKISVLDNLGLWRWNQIQNSSEHIRGHTLIPSTLDFPVEVTCSCYRINFFFFKKSCDSVFRYRYSGLFSVDRGQGSVISWTLTAVLTNCCSVSVGPTGFCGFSGLVSRLNETFLPHNVWQHPPPHTHSHTRLCQNQAKQVIFFLLKHPGRCYISLLLTTVH